jgi:hypothetical protein
MHLFRCNVNPLPRQLVQCVGHPSHAVHCVVSHAMQTGNNPPVWMAGAGDNVNPSGHASRQVPVVPVLECRSSTLTPLQLVQSFAAPPLHVLHDEWQLPLPVQVLPQVAGNVDSDKSAFEPHVKHCQGKGPAHETPQSE